MQTGDRIKNIREGRGWSQRDLAEVSSVHFNSVSGIESGKHKPRPSTLRKLAEALGVEVEDLTGAPKGEPLFPERHQEERLKDYLDGWRRFLNGVERRLWEAMERDELSLERVEMADDLEKDVWRHVVPKIMLMHGTDHMPEAEANAHELLQAALTDLGATVDEAYQVVTEKLVYGEKANVVEIEQLRERREQTKAEQRRAIERIARGA